MTDSLCGLSATEIARLVGLNELGVAQTISTHLRQVEQHNTLVNAICTVNPFAMEEAHAADIRLSTGAPARLLEGVPVVVKDNIETKGLRTTYGSQIYADYVPERDAISVARIKDAGGIIIGKTNLPEFARGVVTQNALFGLTSNPLNPQISAGGSSGGTSAAIASGMAPIGLGTDHGGSIRIPASFCGIYGLRPTPGRVPIHSPDLAWDVPVAHVQGPMARSLGDLALLLSVISGPDDRDPSSLGASEDGFVESLTQSATRQPLRAIYIGDLDGVVPLDAEVDSLVRNAASAIPAAGGRLDESILDSADLEEIIEGTRRFGTLARYLSLYRGKRLLISDRLASDVEDSLRLTAEGLARAEQLRSHFYGRALKLFEKSDVLILPTVGIPPYDIKAPPKTINGRPLVRMEDVFNSTYAISVLGLPCMSMPCGLTASGLPVGLQIVAKPRCEVALLQASACIALQVDHSVVHHH